MLRMDFATAILTQHLAMTVDTTGGNMSLRHTEEHGSASKDVKKALTRKAVSTFISKTIIST
jgi:hypothetical protein